MIVQLPWLLCLMFRKYSSYGHVILLAWCGAQNHVLPHTQQFLLQRLICWRCTIGIPTGYTYLMHLPHPFENMHSELSPVNSINYVTVINSNDPRNFRMDVVYAFIDYITHQYFVSCQRKPLSNNWCQSWFCAPLPAKKWPVRIKKYFLNQYRGNWKRTRIVSS